MEKEAINISMAYIARGLAEKEKLLKENPNNYPQSKILQKGINKFLAASIELGKVGKEVWDYADEASFLKHFAGKAVKDWFENWDEKAVAALELKKEPYYRCENFILYEGRNKYSPDDDCLDFLETLGSDATSEGIEQKILYKKIEPLEQQVYTDVRRFICEKPLATDAELREIKEKYSENKAVIGALNFAYEDWTGKAYRCPKCGWTLIEDGNSLKCHSRHCLDIEPIVTENMIVHSSDYKRLKKGIMRYVCAPGKLEMEIEKFCKDLNLNPILWPFKDTYDIKIVLPDKKIWEIDAKAYRNPLLLAEQIRNDAAFTKEKCREIGEYYDRGFYVIPTEYKKTQIKYEEIVNRAIDPKLNVRCISLYKLKQYLKKEVQK